MERREHSLLLCIFILPSTQPNGRDMSPSVEFEMFLLKGHSLVIGFLSMHVKIVYYMTSRWSHVDDIIRL